ncbi:MAG TPA: hypothetical protein VJT31_36090 [Rugosimonospora sp.]|nr:hypothetical protein [Rugosimonospora sp.]
MSTLTWVDTDPGQVWRSLCGRYAIVAQTLPERPPRIVYQARRVDEMTARAEPERGDLGILLEETPWCWNTQNGVHSAEAICERDAWKLTHPGSLNVPDDHPSVALATFWWPHNGAGSRGALSVAWKNGRLVAQVIGMYRTGVDGVGVGEYTEIDLSDLGITADPATLPTTTDHGPARCPGCGAKVGRPHTEHCERARCQVTGQQRLLCLYFGGSPTAGVQAVLTNTQAEFEEYFKTPTGHDCGEDPWCGEPT